MKPVRRLKRTVSARGVAAYPSIATATASCVASWVETIACSAVSKTFSGSATAGSSAASRARLRVSFASSPAATAPAVAVASAASPSVTRSACSAVLRPSLIRLRISEAYDVIRVDAAGHSPQVQNALRLGDHGLRVDLVMRGDDHGQVALGEALLEADALEPEL